MAVNCVFCSHSIRTTMDNPRDTRTRRDTVAREFCDKWLCGACADDLAEMLTEE